MNKMVSVGVAVFLCAAVVSTGSFAKKWEVTEFPNRDTCYTVTHIPATYSINSKGIKVRGDAEAWSGDYIDGKTVKHTVQPAVYIQTKTLVEADYFSLVPKGTC